MASPLLVLDSISVSLGGSPIVRGLSLELGSSEVIALLGPSGCGKTTTLRAIAGLEPLTAGSIQYEGRDLAEVPTEQRNIGMVFQEGALFPHLDVRRNLGFGLGHLPSAERAARVDELLDLLRIGELSDRAIHQLSGGQRQRVALGRAMARSPHLILLDEPFGSLDGALKRELRPQVLELLKQAGIAAVLVTHDQQEAKELADRVGVLAQGELVQQGSFEAICAAPATPFVRDFLGL